MSGIFRDFAAEERKKRKGERISIGVMLLIIGVLIWVIAFVSSKTKAETTMQGPGYNYVRTVSDSTPGFGPVGIIEVDGHEYVIVRGGVCHKADCRGD